MDKHRRRWLGIASVLLVGGWITACSSRSGMAMSKYPPEDFFDGRHIEVARAMDAGDMARVRALSAGLAIDAVGRKDMTLLWYAIQSKNYPAVSTMIQLGSKPDEQIAQGIGSALDAAVYSKDTRLLQAMLDGGLSPDHRSPKHKQMLQRATGPGGSIEHVRLLVDRGANLNMKDSVGGTALTEAISTLKPDIALYLVERGADIGTFTVNGVSVPWSVQGTINRQQPGPMRTKFGSSRNSVGKFT